MAIKRSRTGVVGLLLAIGLLWLPGYASLGSPSQVFAQAADEEPNPIVTMYAEAMGISYAEAERRLTLQSEMDALEAQVAQGEPTYAGSWTQHQPVFGLVVGFTAPNGTEIIQKYLVDIAWADLVEVKQLPFTVSELLDILTQVNQAASQTGIPFAAGQNVQLGKVTLYSSEPEALQRAIEQQTAIQAYWDDIEYIYQAGLSVPAVDPASGSAPFILYLPTVQG